MPDPAHHLRAFVLQFHTATDPEAGRFEGRVEHIDSGRAAQFRCLEELLSFVRHELIEAARKPVEDFS